jgi:hypothetical protein
MQVAAVDVRRGCNAAQARTAGQYAAAAAELVGCQLQHR